MTLSRSAVSSSIRFGDAAELSPCPLLALARSLLSLALRGDACVERGTANPLNRLGANAKAGGDLAHALSSAGGP